LNFRAGRIQSAPPLLPRGLHPPRTNQKILD
jgi:hypothetical protein